MNEGIQNIIVNPADIPTTDKERKQKEGSRDIRKIAHSLSNGELEGVYVPTQKTEEVRDLVRYRKTVVKDIGRNKSRIKSFLYRHGIEVPLELDTASEYWSSNFTIWLRTVQLNTDFGHTVIHNMLDTVTLLRAKLLEVQKELREIARQEGYANRLNGSPVSPA